MSTPTKFTRFPHHHTRQHHLIIISDTVSPPPQQRHHKKEHHTHTHKINLWKFKNNNLSSFLFTYLYKKTTTYPHPTQKLRQFNVLLDSLSFDSTKFLSCVKTRLWLICMVVRQRVITDMDHYLLWLYVRREAASSVVSLRMHRLDNVMSHVILPGRKE